MSDSNYIHGTSPQEQGRLSLMNRLMNEAAIRELQLRGGERIVDFGCGLAQLSRAMARAAGTRVVGIERSGEQLDEASRQAADAQERELVELRNGDVLDPPLEAPEWGSFDVAHARFVLEHVPDPARVVRNMVRAVKHGGRVVLQDDDHDVLRLWPVPAGFETLWTAYQRSYDRLGNDPWIGRRLVKLLSDGGAEPFRATWIFFGACAGEPAFAGLCENLVGVIGGARDTVVQGGLLDPESWDRAVESLRAWAGRRDAAIWYAICWAEGVKR
jgi:SAM-dependent methyltransferase